MQKEDGLYPEIEPFQTHRLSVDPPHQLYVEESGNPAGIPVVFLHGGPGGGSRPAQRRTFDPERFRIVLFDQRGAGRSTPSAELDGNTTADLIADIERIRHHLGIEAWLVAGGSWGSCLGLAYAIAHPERCLGLRLHGIFLATPDEIRFWFHGIGRFFPDHFEAFVAAIPDAERDDLLTAYYRRLIDPDPAIHNPAAQALRGYSARTQTLLPSDAHVAALTEPKTALEISRIFTHYCMNQAFLPDGHLIEGVATLHHLPCEIVQGRYDVVTPMQSAWRLHRAWPQARLTIVDLANHVPTQEAPALSKALSEATDRLAERLSGDPAPTIEEYLAPRGHTAPAISPDGTEIAWISDRTGVAQIWSMALADGSPAQRVATPERVWSLAFAPKSNDLVFTMDRGGDERHQLWHLPADADEATPLTRAPGVVHVWGTWDRDGGRIAYASNACDARHMDLYVRALDQPEAERVLEGEGWRKPLSFFPDGQSLLVQDNRRGMWDAELVRVDLASGETTQLLAADDDKSHFATAKWAKDGSGLYLLTNLGRAFHGLVWFDLATGALTWLATPDGDIELLAVSPDEKQLAYVVNVEGYGQLYVREVESGDEVALDSLPPGRPTSMLYSPDGVSLIVTHESFTAPPVIYRIDLVSRSAEPLVFGPIELEIGDRVEPTIVNVPSFDGHEVPAFLFEPLDPPEGRPALVIVHGGPESQYAAHWRSDVQYLVSRGWTVVAPNVRGSTGYGREWQSLDDRRLRMDSVKDLKAVRDWLAARPGIDAARLAVYGQSYGGFMVLAAITEYPDDWAVAAEFYGIANFLTLLETTGPWRQVLRAAEYGDPIEDRDALKSFSPIHKADRIKVPLFIAQGLEDPRVPPGESEMVVSVLRGRGHPYEIIRIDGEGHGFHRQHNRLRVYAALIRFLERHITTREGQ